MKYVSIILVFMALSFTAFSSSAAASDGDTTEASTLIISVEMDCIFEKGRWICTDPDAGKDGN